MRSMITEAPVRPGETVGVAVPAPLENVEVPPPGVGQDAAKTVSTGF